MADHGSLSWATQNHGTSSPVLVSTWCCRGSSHRRCPNVRCPIPNRRRPGSAGRSRSSRNLHRQHAPFHRITFTHLLSSGRVSWRAKCPAHLHSKCELVLAQHFRSNNSRRLPCQGPTPCRMVDTLLLPFSAFTRASMVLQDLPRHACHSM